MKLKNNIKNILEEKDISVNWVSQKLNMTYSNTHGLVNKEYLDSTQIITIVKLSKALEVKIEELYEEENEMLREKLEELRKLIGKEFTLLEMDNLIQGILESENSIFEGETEDYIADGEFAYTTWMDEDKEEAVDINVHFEVLEESEGSMEVIIKITDIEEL